MQALYLQNLVAANYQADQAAQKAANKRTAAAAAAAAPPPQTAPEVHPAAAASPHGGHDVCAAPAGSATVTIIPAESEGGGAVADISHAPLSAPNRRLSKAEAVGGCSTGAPLSSTALTMSISPVEHERSGVTCSMPDQASSPAVKRASSAWVRQSTRKAGAGASRGSALAETLYLQFASPRR